MFFWDKFKIENVEDCDHQWQLEKHEPASSDAADTFQLVLKNIWFPTFQLCLQEIMSAVSSERNLQFQTWTRLQCLQCLQCVEREQAGCLSVGRCRRQKLMFFLLNRAVSVSSCLSEPWCLPLRIKNSFSKRISYFSVLLFGLCPVNCSWEGNAAESWKINHPGSVCFACGPFVCFGSRCTSAPLCFLFSCDAPPERPPQSSESIFCQTLISAAPLGAQRTRVQTHSPARSSLLETRLKSRRSSLPSELSPAKLGGHDSIFSSLLPRQLWVPLQPQRLERSFWLWTISPPDSSTRLLSSPRSIFKLRGSDHPADSDVCGCLLHDKKRPSRNSVCNVSVCGSRTSPLGLNLSMCCYFKHVFLNVEYSEVCCRISAVGFHRISDEMRFWH